MYLLNLAFNWYFKRLSACYKTGWSGGAIVLDKLPVPGHPSDVDNSRVRAYCACERCG